jgi:hypothetical protein
MYKIKVVKEVGIAAWRYDSDDDFKYPAKVMYFYFERSIPFAPFVGLRLNGRKVPSEHLVEVTYDFDSNEFFCRVASDNSIPEEVDEEFDTDQHDVDELRQFVADRTKKMESRYLSIGWFVYEG